MKQKVIVVEADTGQASKNDGEAAHMNAAISYPAKSSIPAVAE